jgi:hypothetical protein
VHYKENKLIWLLVLEAEKSRSIALASVESFCAVSLHGGKRKGKRR